MSTELIQTLKDTLSKAKERILKQAEVLNHLTAEPRIKVVVVGVKKAKESPSDYSEFELGVRVRVVNPDSRRSIHLGKTGTIVKDIDGDGEVQVRLDDEEESVSYFGVGKSDAPNRRAELQLLKKAGKVTVLYNGDQVELLTPFGQEISVGQTVLLSTKTMQIIEVGEELGIGETAVVRQVLNESSCEVDYQGATRVAIFGEEFSGVKKGDKVALDKTGSVVVRNLGKEDERFKLEVSVNVPWDEIGGLQDAKQQMVEAIELPLRHPEIFRHYAKKPLKGVLLYGPPGCGKTLIAKAAATSLARLHGREQASRGFIYIKGPEILDKYVGTSEATIRQIFGRARLHRQEHGYPALIFIDEADAILGKRGTGISSDIERTIVPMFLAEMDGLDDSGAIVLLATNRSDVLDPAVVRDGRIDRKIKIPRPDRESALEIFNIHLNGIPFNNGYSREQMAKVGSDELFCDSHALYTVIPHEGTEEEWNGDTKFTLAHVSNGGMIAGIVDQASSLAMRRDLESGDLTGITPNDLKVAVDQVFRQNLDLNHADDLTEFIGDRRDSVQLVKKTRFSYVNAVH